MVEISHALLQYWHSPSVSHPVWIWFLVGAWEVILAALLTWSHCIHHLCISRSFSIGCIYTLIFLLYVLLSSINPQSNSNCQETHSDVVPGVCENMGMKTAMCLERALKETESTASSMPSHESSGQPGGCVHHGLHTPSRALRVGAAAAEEAREALDTI